MANESKAQVKMVTVRAKIRGFFDLNKNLHPVEIQPGTVFQVPENMVGRWMERVEDKPGATPAPQPEQAKKFQPPASAPVSPL